MRRGALILMTLVCVSAGVFFAGGTERAAAVEEVRAEAPAPLPEFDRLCVQSPDGTALFAAEAQPEQAEPEPTIMVLDGGAVRQMALEDYIFHVVAGEMPASYAEEALKSQAVAARTYAAWKRKSGCSRAAGAEVCTDSTHCMAYMSEEELREGWGERYEEYSARIREAVEATAGQVLCYDGEPIQALFHSSSSGSTEDAMAVWGADCPYLRSVSSGEKAAARTVRFSAEKLAAQLNRAFPGAELTKSNIGKNFRVKSYTQSGRVKSVQVGQVSAEGKAVRTALHLSSTDFSIKEEDGEILITARGYGHGVGMSQDGANDMALRGSSAEEILRHYYPGTVLGTWPE